MKARDFIMIVFGFIIGAAGAMMLLEGRPTTIIEERYLVEIRQADYVYVDRRGFDIGTREEAKIKKKPAAPGGTKPAQDTGGVSAPGWAPGS